MKKLWMAAVSLMVALPMVGRADVREMIVVGEMIEVNAAPAAVWKVVRDFDGLVNWLTIFQSTPLLWGSNGQVGAVRELTIKDNGPKVVEELTAYSEERMAYTYIILDTDLPLANYQSSMSVKESARGGSVVSWIGTFKRKNARDNPAEGESDAALAKLISGAYQAGLTTIKQQAEGK